MPRVVWLCYIKVWSKKLLLWAAAGKVRRWIGAPGFLYFFFFFYPCYNINRGEHFLLGPSINFFHLIFLGMLGNWFLPCHTLQRQVDIRWLSVVLQCLWIFWTFRFCINGKNKCKGGRITDGTSLSWNGYRWLLIIYKRANLFVNQERYYFCYLFYLILLTRIWVFTGAMVIQNYMKHQHFIK